MKLLPLLCSACLAVSLSPLAAEDGLLPNPSFEQVSEGRPTGFRNFLSPAEAPPGDNFVQDGMEGEMTHTGRRALQFYFPDGAEITQSVWMADPRLGGCRAEPGRYTCSFWAKAENMVEGLHLWVTLTGYGADNAKTGEVARSEYLRRPDLPEGEWKQFSFTFDVPVQDGVASLAPSIIFKTHPDARIHPVPADTRILVDDVQIAKE